jgi:hypothetical protein
MVSLAELRPDANPGCVRRVVATLERLEAEVANTDQIDAAHAAWLKAENERVAFQRSLWAALPEALPAVRAPKAAMLDRCLDLMTNNSGEECDALAEFLPEVDVEAMFAQWEREVFPEAASSTESSNAD